MICPNCKKDTLIWGCDYTFEDYGLPEDGLVKTYSCASCGAFVDVYVSNEREEDMNFNEYQLAAGRTMSDKMTKTDKELHALHGMVGEIGELHSIYQKRYQGHTDTEEHRKKELGDLLWFIAEYCTANGWWLDEIAKLNIRKLEERYPDGFDTEHSLHRKTGDV